VVEFNPFFHRGPIHDPAYFFGRQRELVYLFDLVRQRQSVAIFGPRRMGKTSLLFHATHPEIIRKAGFDPARTRCVTVDGGMLDGLDEAWLNGAIGRGLGGEIDAIPFDHLVGQVRALARQGDQLIVALDEFDLIAANPRFDASVFNRLKGLAAQYPIQFITASTSPLANLPFASGEARRSHFFNNFAACRLATFDSSEAADLLSALSARSGKPFAEADIERILDWVGTHPLFLQIAAYRVFAAMSNDATGVEAIDEIRQQIIEDIEPHLEYYWNGLTAEDRTTLAALPLHHLPPSDPALQRLASAGVIAAASYPGDLVREFVRRQSVEGLLQAGPFVMDIRRRVVSVDGKLVHLTPTEFSALRLLLETGSHLLTPEDIETALWPSEIAPDPERARGVMKKLRRTLGTAGEHIVTMRGQGYLFRGK